MFMHRLRPIDYTFTGAHDTVHSFGDGVTSVINLLTLLLSEEGKIGPAAHEALPANHLRKEFDYVSYERNTNHFRQRVEPWHLRY